MSFVCWLFFDDCFFLRWKRALELAKTITISRQNVHKTKFLHGKLFTWHFKDELVLIFDCENVFVYAAFEESWMLWIKGISFFLRFLIYCTMIGYKKCANAWELLSLQNYSCFSCNLACNCFLTLAGRPVFFFCFLIWPVVREAFPFLMDWTWSINSLPSFKYQK